MGRWLCSSWHCARLYCLIFKVKQSSLPDLGTNCPVTRLTLQKTSIFNNTAVRTSNITMQIQSKYNSLPHHRHVIMSEEKWKKLNTTLLTMVRINLIGIGTQQSQTCLTDIHKSFQFHKSCQVTWHWTVYVGDVNKPSLEGVPTPL